MSSRRWIIGLGLLGLAGKTLAADIERPSPLQAMDSDGDGNVSFVEFQEADFKPLARLDSDGDGVLTLEEFIHKRPGRGRGDGPGGNRQDEEERRVNEERLAQLRERMLQRQTERFNELDLDGDATLTAMELKEAAFLRMDRDDNGLLSAEELRRPRRGGPSLTGRDHRPRGLPDRAGRRQSNSRDN